MATHLKKRLLMILLTSILPLAVGAGSVSAGNDNGDGTISYVPFFFFQKQPVVWLKNANCFGKAMTCLEARDAAASLRSGMCGLTDNSTAGQWRLPTKEELIARMRDKSGFINVVGGPYWSSTPAPPLKYWDVSSYDGTAAASYCPFLYFAWFVRDPM